MSSCRRTLFTPEGKLIVNKEGKTYSIDELKRAKFYPNLKYFYLGADREFATRSAHVSWPPINLEASRNFRTRGEDLLIFRIGRQAQGYLSDYLTPSGRKRGSRQSSSTAKPNSTLSRKEIRPMPSIVQACHPDRPAE